VGELPGEGGGEVKLHERLRKAAELLDRADVLIGDALIEAHGDTFDKVQRLSATVATAKFLADEAANDAEAEEETK
jgi:hypothetical protein